MKRIILFATLLAICISSPAKIFASGNDSCITSYMLKSKGHKLSILGCDLHYLTKSKIRIEQGALVKGKDSKSKFCKTAESAENIKIKCDFGTVEHISNDWYYITPNKKGDYSLFINDEKFEIKVFDTPEPKIYFSGINNTWKKVITKDDLVKTPGIEAKNNYAKFEVLSYSLLKHGVYGKVKYYQGFEKNEFVKNINVGDEFLVSNIKVKYPDGSIHDLPDYAYRVIDNYDNEFLRQTVKPVPYTSDLGLLKTDLRIKILGHPQKGDLKIIQELADELNGILRNIKVKVVDEKPSINLVIDSIDAKSEAFYKKHHIQKTNGCYKEVSNGFFFPFRSAGALFFDTNVDSTERRLYLRKCIIDLLGNFNKNEVDSSIFNNKDLPNLCSYDLNLLKKLYSIDEEYPVLKIIDEKFDYPDRNNVFFIIFMYSICLLFVFFEIYKYYGFNNLIGKIKNKIVRRIIESALVAQIPVLAIFTILCFKFIGGDFHEADIILIFETFFIPFAIIAGLLFLGVDLLLDKIKRTWIVIILNFVLSIASVWVAYQMKFLLITPEIITPDLINWKFYFALFSIVLFRLYSRFQTNKLTSLLQEKELELSRQKELKLKSDLNALQSRINPHFLYNALNSLASLAHIDATRTEKMALSLSKLFRYNINKDDEHSTSIRQEIEMINIYLEIEKNRFDEMLTYSINVEEDLNDFVIPKFLLQPLVENAVKHGTSQITEKGIIEINIFEEKGKVIVDIFDNGPKFNDGLTSGYGLQNTYEKLKLLYNKQSDIEFINEGRKHLRISLEK